MIIKDNMNWPPSTIMTHKMCEHSAWYSGEVDYLSNFYSSLDGAAFLGNGSLGSKGMFWGRQATNNNPIITHVPIAGDIAETSANLLFGESPSIKIAQAHAQNASSTFLQAQDDVDDMLLKSMFFSKIIEAAEGCAAIGGIFIKIAYDEELSEFPIPVVTQADKAIPEFRFGILTAVTFWKELEESTESIKYRVLERYEKGAIKYTLYKGTADKLGYPVALKECKETEDLQEVVQTVDDLLVVYIPNMLPNKLDRHSYLGRSDYSGIERLMDSLDETFSSWMKDIVLAQAKMLVPSSFLSKMNIGEGAKFNIDQLVYAQMDIDPTMESKPITPMQFAIRAAEFEKTAINLIERIVTSSGYSPQSFGINIEGRAESGTALAIRERKSFSTKSKKQNYWQAAMAKLVKLMVLVYNDELRGDIEPNVDINISFNDSITNDLTEMSSAVKMISDAQAASTETKVRLLHPDWSEKQIAAEVKTIIEEGKIAPLDNPDMFQLGSNTGADE